MLINVSRRVYPFVDLAGCLLKIVVLREVRNPLKSLMLSRACGLDELPEVFRIDGTVVLGTSKGKFL